MKKIKLFVLLAVLMLSANSYADWKPEFPKNNSSKVEKLKLNKDLNLARKDFQEKSGKFLDFYVDLKLGGTSTNASVTQQNGLGSYNTASKIGFNAGAIMFIRLLDQVQFSTGLDFTGKNFEITPPTNVNNPQPGATTRVDSTTTKVTSNFMNIPINFNFGTNITDDLGITFNGGPYLGILLNSTENAGLGYKNFDLGLNGTLTFNYRVAPLTSVILGAKFEYGGLNNLGSTPYVDKVTTSTLGIFSGVRFAID